MTNIVFFVSLLIASVYTASYDPISDSSIEYCVDSAGVGFAVGIYNNRDTSLDGVFFIVSTVVGTLTIGSSTPSTYNIGNLAAGAIGTANVEFELRYCVASTHQVSVYGEGVRYSQTFEVSVTPYPNGSCQIAPNLRSCGSLDISQPTQSMGSAHARSDADFNGYSPATIGGSSNQTTWNTIYWSVSASLGSVLIGTNHYAYTSISNLAYTVTPAYNAISAVCPSGGCVITSILANHNGGNSIGISGQYNVDCGGNPVDGLPNNGTVSFTYSKCTASHGCTSGFSSSFSINIDITQADEC